MGERAAQESAHPDHGLADMTTAQHYAVDFGRYLQTHRRSKHIPIETVSQKTKITVTVLRQLEAEDLANLPAPAFVKGFIRAYAEAIGADAQDALRRYQAGYEHRFQKEEPPSAPREGFWKRFLLSGFIFLFLIAITLFLFNRFTDRRASSSAEPALSAEKSSPAAGVEEKAADAAPMPVQPEPEALPEKKPDQPAAVPVKPIQPASASPQEVQAVSAMQEHAPAAQPLPQAQDLEPAADLPAAAASDASPVLPADASPPPVEMNTLKLELTAVELTWLRVTMDGGESREVTLQPDERVTFEAAKRFDLLIGNAGGIHLTLNDQAVALPAVSGKVVSLHLP